MSRRPVPPGDEIATTKFREGVLYERPSVDGDRKFQLQIQNAAVHVPDDVAAYERGDPVTWEDPDLDWVDRTTIWGEGTAWYTVTVPKTGRVGFDYASRTQAAPVINITLTHVDGSPVGVLPVPVVRGTELWWDDVAPGLDMFLRLLPDGVELRKRIRTAAAPRTWVWHVEHTDGMGITIPRISQGRDNFDLLEPTRDPGTGPSTRRRKCEIENLVRNEIIDRGMREYDWTETWTGNTFTRHPVTRVLQLESTGEVYPIEIDVLVEEEIAADADDGYEHTGNNSWNNSYGGSNNNLAGPWTGYDWIPGFRFTTVAIPQGATVDDATFAVERVSTVGSCSSTMYGDDTDDAAPFDNTNRVSTRTKTTASVAATWNGSDGTDVSLDVQGIIQEIVNRGSWASGNDLALISGSMTGSNSYTYLEDEADADVGAGRLDVNYTVAGGGLPIPVAMHNYRRRHQLSLG